VPSLSRRRGRPKPPPLGGWMGTRGGAGAGLDGGANEFQPSGNGRQTSRNPGRAQGGIARSAPSYPGRGPDPGRSKPRPPSGRWGTHSAGSPRETTVRFFFPGPTSRPDPRTMKNAPGFQPENRFAQPHVLRGSVAPLPEFRPRPPRWMVRESANSRARPKPPHEVSAHGLRPVMIHQPPSMARPEACSRKTRYRSHERVPVPGRSRGLRSCTVRTRAGCPGSATGNAGCKHVHEIELTEAIVSRAGVWRRQASKRREAPPPPCVEEERYGTSRGEPGPGFLPAPLGGVGGKLSEPKRRLKADGRPNSCM